MLSIVTLSSVIVTHNSTDRRVPGSPRSADSLPSVCLAAFGDYLVSVGLSIYLTDTGRPTVYNNLNRSFPREIGGNFQGGSRLFPRNVSSRNLSLSLEHIEISPRDLFESRVKSSEYLFEITLYLRLDLHGGVSPPDLIKISNEHAIINRTRG